MASGLSTASPTTPLPSVSPQVSDCPQCQSLCVGALLLPCGHLTCRKCLRDHHGSQLTCHTCQQTLPLPKDADFSSLVQQLRTDPVVVHLVNQRLRSQRHMRCLMCDNRDATTICHDCRESYCDGCAKGHRKQGATKDHVLQTLLQQNVSSASCQTFRPKTHSASSTESMECISNPLDQPQSSGQSSGSKHWKQWVAEAIEVLQEALRDQNKLLAAFNDVVSRAQHVLTVVQAQQELLQLYINLLPLFRATDQYADVNIQSFEVTFPDDDVSVKVTMDAMQQRILDVIGRQRSAEVVTDMTSLMNQLKELLSIFEDMTTAGHSSTTMPTDTPSSPTVEPMTTCPRRVFATTPACDDDTDTPGITSIISTQDGQRLLMVDCWNSKVKLLDMNPPHSVSHSLTMKEKPWRPALLHDGLVAMTTVKPIIFLLNVSNTVTVATRINTDIRYIGIAGHSDGTLIVSCDRGDNKGIACVNIIRRNGDVVRIITDSNRLTTLKSPYNLCVVQNHLLVSDCTSDAVFRVEVSTGHLVDTLTHAEMKYPRQVTTDTSGQVYIASESGHCVLLKPPGGQWRKLLTASDHSDQGYEQPSSVCVTDSGHLFVGWWNYSKYVSRVMCYDL